MIGPFYLPVDLPLSCCCCSSGLLVGTIVVLLFTIMSAGSSDVRDDRSALLEVLTVDCAMRPEQVKSVMDKVLSKWARYRYKTRPILWHLKMDWPEFQGTGTLKADYIAEKAPGLVESQSGSEQSEEPVGSEDQAD